jgi:hypothetical protein
MQKVIVFLSVLVAAVIALIAVAFTKNSNV